ncbi:hypothetical protein ABZ370_41255 [Streptomyces sp. NPDC005962]|uniref:hypothetical protein n=1 Tax=Streptomyces sp. NPDC005962 TaxID=3154466 RepID=UPI0033C0750C
MVGRGPGGLADLVRDGRHVLGGALDVLDAALVTSPVGGFGRLRGHGGLDRRIPGASRGLNDPLMRRLLEVYTPGILLSCPSAEGFLFGNVKGRNLPPGRGRRIARRKSVQIQAALLAPEGT